MKALILSDSFMGYGEACKNAFERMGFSTKLFMWSMFPSHTSFKDHIWLRLYGEDYIKHIIDSHIRQFDNEVLILAEEFSPDIVVVLFGTQISIDLAKTLFQKYTTVLLLKDTTKRYGYINEIVPYFHLIATYDPTQVNEIKQINKNVFYLPEGYDDIHFMKRYCDKEYDVCYIGSFYVDRKEIVERLTKDLPERKFIIGGEICPFRKNPFWYLKNKHIDKSSVFLNRILNYDECCELYNKSKISLNLKGNQLGDGWSSRLLEIMATGSMVISPYNEIVGDIFKGCIETYSDYEELRDKISFYLYNDEARLRIVQKGTLKAQEYSYLEQYKKLIEEIKSRQLL